MHSKAATQRNKRVEQQWLMESLMSIVLNVHPGVQLDTRVDSKKSFCCSVTEGTSLHLQNKSFQDRAKIHVRLKSFRYS